MFITTQLLHWAFLLSPAKKGLRSPGLQQNCGAESETTPSKGSRGVCILASWRPKCGRAEGRAGPWVSLFRGFFICRGSLSPAAGRAAGSAASRAALRGQGWAGRDACPPPPDAAAGSHRRCELLMAMKPRSTLLLWDESQDTRMPSPQECRRGNLFIVSIPWEGITPTVCVDSTAQEHCYTCADIMHADL